MGRRGGLRARCRHRCSTWWITCKCHHAAVDTCRTCAAACRSSRRTLTICCTKTYLVALNFMFLICGCTMLGVGCWMRVDSESELYVRLFNAVPASGPLAVLDHLPSVFVLVGGSVALLSFLGCCGACADSACFLCLFTLLLCLMLVTEVVVVVVVGVFRAQILSKMEFSLLHQIHYEYNKTGRMLNGTELNSQTILSQHVTVVMDAIQVKFNCCGVVGPGDYRDSAWFNRTRHVDELFVPSSCCLEPARRPTAKSSVDEPPVCQLDAILLSEPGIMPPVTALKTRGCHKSFSQWYSANTVVYIAVVIVVISLQVLDLAAAATLMSWVRQKHTNCQWSDDSDFG